MAEHGPEDHDLGLSHDLPQELNRRRALTLLGGGAVIVGAGVGGFALGTRGGTDAGTDSGLFTGRGRPDGGPGGGEAVPEGTIPSETAGPYPGDGSNGPNVLDDTGIVRSDITSSFGGATGVAAGVPLTLKLNLKRVSSEGSAEGYAVYLWHADAEGRYSLYSKGATEENYLRGVQIADTDGAVTFTSIFPGCYDGRWPHIHFEIYESTQAATDANASSSSGRLRTTQLAFPLESCEAAYTDARYPASAKNLSRLSLDGDMVFRDGYSLQLATMSGDASTGFHAQLNVPL